MVKSREIRLKSRPSGAISKDNFELATTEISPPAEGEALIKNLWMSIDAGQRVLMGPGESDILDLPPKRFALGEPLEGQALGQVIASRREDLALGSYVTSNFGWREYFKFAGKPDGFGLSVIKSPAAPIQTYLHVMSLFGAAAYFGLTDVAQLKAGDTVWISSAAGSVGSIACQIAKLSGCRVVGTAGSDEKVAWLKNDLRLDVAINYKKSDLRTALKTACPEGIDVYLDFIGGEHLETAIDLMNPRGRLVIIGQTPLYDGGTPQGPKNIFSVILKRLRIQGFTVFDYLEPLKISKFQKLMAKWIADKQITYRETVYEGIDNAAQAQIDLFRGKNIGKMLVKLGEPEQFA